MDEMTILRGSLGSNVSEIGNDVDEVKLSLKRLKMETVSIRRTLESIRKIEIELFGLVTFLAQTHQTVRPEIFNLFFRYKRNNSQVDGVYNKPVSNEGA